MNIAQLNEKRTLVKENRQITVKVNFIKFVPKQLLYQMIDHLNAIVTACDIWSYYLQNSVT